MIWSCVKFLGIFIILLVISPASAWATFEICEGVSTMVSAASVIITSPGYLGTSKVSNTGPQMCECIIQSNDKADMYIDYLQTEIANDGERCPWEYVMLESKKDIRQNETDQKIQVCGQQHVDGRWFQGTVRITYASGGPMQKRGLLAKFTADNIGNKPLIQLECGKGNAEGLNLTPRPAGAQSTNPKPAAPSIFGPSGLPSMRTIFDHDIRDLGFGLPMMPSMPSFPSSVPNSPVPKWTVKLAPDDHPIDDAPSLRVNLPMDDIVNAVLAPSAPQQIPVATEHPRPPAPLVPAEKPPPKSSQPKEGPTNDHPSRPAGGPRRRVPKKNGAGMVSAEDGGEPALEEEMPVQSKTNSSGGMVALVFAGIGAVLILGSVGILFMHNYRKRQRIRRKEQTYVYSDSVSGTYGKGWETSSDGESVYATVADVDAHRDGCVNPAVASSDGLTTSDAKTNDAASECNLQGGRPNSTRRVSAEYKTADRKGRGQVVKPNSEIAVIDVHRSFDAEDASSNGLHTVECLRGAASSESLTLGNSCTVCNIVRPPRRRDSNRVYDNNVGVLRNKQ